jgi:hypothetical protein
MRVLLGLIVVCSGCTLYLSGDDHPPVCSTTTLEPAPASLVDPSTLACELIHYPGVCPPGCACPATGAGAEIPSWGSCDSPCRKLDEQACGADPTCRIARDWASYYENRPSFVGCYPTDTQTIIAERCEPLDAWGCSRDHNCMALYESTPNDCATCAQEQFQECIPAGQRAGSCGLVTCRAVGPTCPTGTTPGVENGCYTGACIPTQFCAPGV